MERSVIRFEDVHFAYSRSVPVLVGLDLEVGPGLNLVAGPNGCGKSTLLKLVAGVEKPHRGVVRVAGHDLWSEEVAARRHIAYLPEHPDLTPYASVEDILRMVAGLRGEPSAGVAEALEWVGLADVAQRTVRELSKGQRRRAVLAACRLGTPDCLLLDEPLEGMDRGFRGALLEWIASRRRDGATMLVVTHEIEALVDSADRVVTVVNGQCWTIPRTDEDLEEWSETLESVARGDNSARSEDSGSP
jgi:ABC-type multidrug transport system ATPase subunit